MEADYSSTKTGEYRCPLALSQSTGVPTSSLADYSGDDYTTETVDASTL